MKALRLVVVFSCLLVGSTQGQQTRNMAQNEESVKLYMRGDLYRSVQERHDPCCAELRTKPLKEDVEITVSTEMWAAWRHAVKTKETLPYKHYLALRAGLDAAVGVDAVTVKGAEAKAITPVPLKPESALVQTPRDETFLCKVTDTQDVRELVDKTKYADSAAVAQWLDRAHYRYRFACPTDSRKDMNVFDQPVCGNLPHFGTDRYPSYGSFSCVEKGESLAFWLDENYMAGYFRDRTANASFVIVAKWEGNNLVTAAGLSDETKELPTLTLPPRNANTVFEGCVVTENRGNTVFAQCEKGANEFSGRWTYGLSKEPGTQFYFESVEGGKCRIVHGINDHFIIYGGRRAAPHCD